MLIIRTYCERHAYYIYPYLQLILEYSSQRVQPRKRSCLDTVADWQLYDLGIIPGLQYTFVVLTRITQNVYDIVFARLFVHLTY